MPADELKARTTASYPYSETHYTRWSDNDQYGHVNNSVYQHYFDTVINQYLIKHCALSPQVSPIIGLAVATSCQYFRPLSFPQRLFLGLRVNRLGTSSTTYEVGVFAEGDGDGAAHAPAAVGTFTHVFVDSQSRMPVPIPPEMRAGLAKLLVRGNMPSDGKSRL